MKSIFYLVFGLLLFHGCVQDTSLTENQTPDIPKNQSMSNLPISERDFYIGLVPTPKNIPETTFDDMTAAYEESASLGETLMVWTDPSGIGQHDRLTQNQVITAVRVYGLKPVLTLNFFTIEEVPGEGLKVVINAPDGLEKNISDPEFRSQWVEEAKLIAQDFQPEYFSLGNEINSYFYFYPEDLDAYETLYDEAYSEIKKVSPDTKVFVVFSYNQMIANDQYYLLETFNDKVDFMGLTTYPWHEYNTSDKIPEDYYSKLNDYTDKPIIFSEIGWPSSESESEQADFLLNFLELTKNNDVEMINWLFLHEMTINGTMASITRPETGTISLKHADGTKKEIYDLWVELKQLKLTR